MRILLALALGLVLSSCGTRRTSRINVIPQPYKIVEYDYNHIISTPGYVVLPDSLTDLSDYLSEMFGKNNFEIVRTELLVGDIFVDMNLQDENEEAYKLNVNGANIHISASNRKGVVRAFNTLLQLSTIENDRIIIPRCLIYDKPRFSYRGLHLDVSRHFYDVEDVKEVLAYMARYKLNKFHWHLTDDEGWRIEIKKYPELTEKGAWRTLNADDRHCQTLEVTLNDMSYRLPRKYIKVVAGDSLYGGYYTQDQIREVIDYATVRGIDVIPEIDMPGHIMSAVQVYPWLSCSGDTKREQYYTDPLCVGNKQTITFAKDVFTEIASLFPYEYIHIGGDEVHASVWSKCSKCSNIIASNGLTDEKELQSYFTTTMAGHLDSLGKKIIGWDNIAEGNIPSTATVMWWRNWAPNTLLSAAKNGNDIVITPSFMFYFNGNEGKEDFFNTYHYEPIPSDFPSELSDKIIGVQGCLWTETTPSIQQLQHQYFPRILAIAESGWSQSKDKNWEDFKRRYFKEVLFWNRHNLSYHIPHLYGFYSVNAFMQSAIFAPLCNLPTVEIRYTTDLSNPDADSRLYTEPITITENTVFKFRAVRPDRTLGEIFTSTFKKELPDPGVDADPRRDGIACKQYFFQGNNCSEITQSDIKGRYVRDSIDIPQDAAKGWVGLEFDGYFEALQSGTYTFRLTSNDGSMLYINDSLLIDNDGPHIEKFVAAQKILEKGVHKIKVLYFDSNNGGSLKLEWKLEGAGDFEVMKGFRY